MIFEATSYTWAPLASFYFLASVVIFGFGAAVLLYQRFTFTSRYFFLLTTIVAVWLTPLGLAILANDAATTEAWLRVAFIADPFTAAAMYALALRLGRVRRPKVERLAWLLASLFSLSSVLGPWLVRGLDALTQRYTLGSAGWLGALYFLFISTILGLALWELARSRRRSSDRKERSETLLLTMAAGVASLTLVDYWTRTEPFRTGVITPVAITLAVVAVAFVASRYRVFLLSHSFGTDAVLQAMSDAVVVFGPSGLVRGSNPAARRLLGRKGSMLLGLPANQLFEYREGAGGGDWSLASRTSRRDLNLAAVRSDGERVAVSVSTEPLRVGGRVAGTVIVARDIRERLEAERAVQASQRRYSSLFWHNPASLYEFDLEGRFIAVNPAAERLLGYTSKQLVGRSFTEVIDPPDLERAQEVFEAVLTGGSREYELAVVTASGVRREIRGVSIPIFDSGRVVGVFGVALDVSEATGAKRELEVQRRYFADLFESSPEGIVLVEAETDRVHRVNTEFTRMFGYTAEEVVGRNLNDLIVPDDRKSEGPDFNRAAREGGRLRAETVRCHKDGTPVEVSVLARSLSIPGEPEQLYGVYRDIGDRLETERALREREEELRHAQKLEAVGKLAGGIAHDFNNLLTVINGHAGFALENVEPGSSALQQDLLEIEKAGARAAALTQQLLAYSRRQMLHPQVLDPNAVVLEIQGMLGRLIGEHIRVETHLTREDVRVRADRGQLEQVLVNLVVNARDAMPGGGRLTLETHALTLEPGDPRLDRWEVAPGHFVRIRVTDTGVGMEPDILEHIFEPFFTTKEQGKGTGLGLATVFGIVKQSGGHVTMSSVPGAGTTCDVMLPHTEVAVRAPDVESPHEPVERPEGTVLVVEDEAPVRKLVVRILERAGCAVLSAEDGARALRVLEDHDGEVDLVISDLVMPEMGGRELAAHLRRTRPALPVLFMSGYDDDLSAEGVDDAGYLAKPFTPASLVRWVSEALRAAPSSNSSRSA